jgi:hypothetical protein
MFRFCISFTRGRESDECDDDHGSAAPAYLTPCMLLRSECLSLLWSGKAARGDRYCYSEVRNSGSG